MPSALRPQPSSTPDPRPPTPDPRPLTPTIIWLDATDAVREADCPKCLNIYMVGALSQLLPIADEHWPQALRRVAPERHFRINLQMFRAGRRALTQPVGS